MTRNLVLGILAWTLLVGSGPLSGTDQPPDLLSAARNAIGGAEALAHVHSLHVILTRQHVGSSVGMPDDSMSESVLHDARVEAFGDARSLDRRLKRRTGLSDVRVEVRINLAALQGGASQTLQRLLDVIDFSRAGAPLVTDELYPVRSDFFKFHPSGNTRLALEGARAASQEWHVLHALREALEVTSTFLEEVRRCCALYRMARIENPLGSDLHRIDRESRGFHRLGLPLKIQRLRQDFGVDSAIGSHIVSVNNARNCIVHREGIVTEMDVAADGQLSVSWSRLVLMARSPDGLEDRVIEGSLLVEEGGRSLLVHESDHEASLWASGSSSRLRTLSE